MPRLAVLIAILLTASTAAANPKIYTYLDAQGQRHYTDVPDNNRYRLLVLSSQDRTASGDRYDFQLLAKATQYDSIIEHAAVPRFLLSDFPLGNSAGKPHDVESQAVTLELALRLLETASGARTTMQSPLRWSEDAAWKLDYNNLSQMSPEELARRRAEFDKQKEIARGNRAA